MSLKISALPDLSGADTLMVAKIIDYPLEKADYKPFAQTRMCVLPEGLALQMWAFEVKPSPHSSLRAVMGPENGPVLSAQVWSDGRLEVLCDGKPAENLCTLTPMWGEDLQGIYWGASLVFDRSRLEQLWGSGCLTPENILRGNVYKLSDDPVKPHLGSLYPADFAGGDPYGAGSMGELEFVSY